MTLVDDRPTATGTLRVMSEDGDTPITWTRGVQVEEDAARDHYEKMRRHGYVAYRVERGPEGRVTDRELIRAFDPALGEIVMVPQRQGG